MLASKYELIVHKLGKLQVYKLGLAASRSVRLGLVSLHSCIRRARAAKFTSFKFDLQPGSLTDQVAGENQPSKKHP